MKKHKLKIDPEPYEAALRGLKPWEFRKDDRGFEVGDEVELAEWMPITEWYSDDEGMKHRNPHFTGRSIHGHITYILRRGFGLPDGYCVFTYEPLKP